MDEVIKNLWVRILEIFIRTLCSNFIIFHLIANNLEVLKNLYCFKLNTCTVFENESGNKDRDAV